MNDKQKKIYTLNYYNDRKTIAKNDARNTYDELNKINSTNKSRSEQFGINLMGSDFLNQVGNMRLKSAEVMYKHYSKKVDSTLNDIGDVKLKTIKTRRHVTSGNTTYSWIGDTYVEE